MARVQNPEDAGYRPPSKPRRRRAFSPQELDRFAQQDQRVFELVVRYRHGEPVAAGIVLELMPAVRAKVRHMSALPPLYRHADLRQELVLELLSKASTLPLRGPEFLTRRLMLAATQRLVRRLEREWRRQQNQISLEELEHDDEEEVEE